MKESKTTMILFIIFVICFTAMTIQAKELIQMAILLDTSNSMDGLINQAKSQLWKIVNELALAKRAGKSPQLEVALYEYGNDNLAAGEGYLRMICPLTKDLDKISDELFKLKTYGGQEYCGYVIKAATAGLKWEKNNDVLKVIYIAGNEPFSQGNIDYMESCKNAIKKGIIINTIFCGEHQAGINTKWKDGADLADGEYISINQNEIVEDIKAPQDEEIIRLGQELNKTYIAYGQSGKEKKVMQEAQDMNAASIGSGNLAQRTLTKASKQYYNASWDLVDAAKEGEVNIDELKDEELPEEMKKMNKKERKEHVNKMKNQREELQKKINKLNEERRKYVANELKKKTKDNTLDTAVIKTIHKQAAKKDYQFK